MKAQITEKTTTKTIQFAWENQVLYLKIEEVPLNGKKIYYIKDTPEDKMNFSLSYEKVSTSTICSPTFNNSFEIKVPVGKIFPTIFYPSQIKKTIEDSKVLIERNIEYLNNLQEILDYIYELEKNSVDELEITKEG
jgi:hypothetical protein